VDNKREQGYRGNRGSKPYQKERPYNRGERSNRPYNKDQRSFSERAPREDRRFREDAEGFEREDTREDDRLNPDFITGRNAVLEALRNERSMESINIAKGENKGSILKIIAMAKDQGIPVKEVSTVKLDAMSGGAPHQGVIGIASAHEYATMEDLFARAEEKGEKPFFIICDELEDPHNLGAVIRTAEAAGAHGVIVPKRRSAGLTPVVYKTSAGAVEYLPVVRVANLASTMEELKEKGVWIYAADMDGENWRSVDYTGSVALVIGSEGRGVGRLIKDQCDFLVSMPMNGKITSLNASVAAGILMYEVARQRAGLIPFTKKK